MVRDLHTHTNGLSIIRQWGINKKSYAITSPVHIMESHKMPITGGYKGRERWQEVHEQIIVWLKTCDVKCHHIGQLKEVSQAMNIPQHQDHK